jgi:TM2 domain-containing membrane protein YozV
MTRDLRKYSRQTQNRLILGFLALVFFLGDGLIYLFWGREAALMGLICLLLGLTPAVLVWGFLILLDWLVRKEQEKRE